MGHVLVRVWNEGESGNFTYAFRCSCGTVEGDYITEHYARDAYVEHAEA